LKDLLSIFCKATGCKSIRISPHSSSGDLSNQEKHYISQILDLQARDLDSRMKYLGFTLKENGYLKNDWLWLLAKVEKKVNAWCNRWLSRADRLVLVKES
jgi:hypothetical protein